MKVLLLINSALLICTAGTWAIVFAFFTNGGIYEPNKAIAIWEMILASLFTLVGIGSIIYLWRRK